VMKIKRKARRKRFERPKKETRKEQKPPFLLGIWISLARGGVGEKERKKAGRPSREKEKNTRTTCVARVRNSMKRKNL